MGAGVEFGLCLERTWLGDGRYWRGPRGSFEAMGEPAAEAMGEPAAESQKPVSMQDLEYPTQEPGVQDSSDFAPDQHRAAPPSLEKAQSSSEFALARSRSLGRKKGHESCEYRPPLWSMSLGDPHGQWLNRDVAARSKIRSSKCASHVSACSSNLRERRAFDRASAVRSAQEWRSYG